MRAGRASGHVFAWLSHATRRRIKPPSAECPLPPKPEQDRDADVAQQGNNPKIDVRPDVSAWLPRQQQPPDALDLTGEAGQSADLVLPTRSRPHIAWTNVCQRRGILRMHGRDERGGERRQWAYRGADTRDVATSGSP